jgi:tripartite-type tricarboxylate transporter receptor subunit TctC
VLAPAKTPAAILGRLSKEIAAALALPDVAQKLVAADLFAAPSTPEQFSTQLRNDIRRWGQVVKDANITAD